MDDRAPVRMLDGTFPRDPMSPYMIWVFNRFPETIQDRPRFVSVRALLLGVLATEEHSG